MVSVGPTVPPSGHAGHHGAALGLELGAAMLLTCARLSWSPQTHYANYTKATVGGSIQESLALQRQVQTLGARPTLQMLGDIRMMYPPSLSPALFTTPDCCGDPRSSKWLIQGCLTLTGHCFGQHPLYCIHTRQTMTTVVTAGP